MFFGKKEKILKKEEKFSLDKFRQLVEEDKKIEAIKIVRIFTGTGLKEAKDFVEHFQTTGCSWEAVREAFRDIADKLTDDINNREEIHREGNDIKEIKNLLRSGNKIMAIKRIRELTDAGLKEAKDFADYFEQTGFYLEKEKFPSIIMKLTGEMTVKHEQLYVINEKTSEIEALLKNGRKIEAIKRIRELTDAGLKEAKDFADYLEEVNFSWDHVSKKFPSMADKITGR